jgi:uncharacterized delta-60 repeat protein
MLKTIALLLLFVFSMQFNALSQTSGQLDNTFGDNGVFDYSLVFPYFEDIHIKTQYDNKILLLGNYVVSGVSRYYSIICRIDSNGGVDTTFNKTGKLVLSFDPFVSLNNIEVDINNKILISGSAALDKNASADFFIAKLNQDGSFDSSFGNGGMVLTDFYNKSDYSCNAFYLPNSKIIVVGGVKVDENEDKIGIVCYNSNGTIDNTFGYGGKNTMSYIGEKGASRASFLQPDNKILVTGELFNASGSDLFVARFNSDGQPDASFGINGIISFNLNNYDRVTSISMSKNNDIIISGWAGSDNYILKLSYYGEVDSSFGINGVLEWGSGGNCKSTFQKDDKMIVSYSSYVGKKIMATRLNIDGSLDNTFFLDPVFDSFQSPISDFVVDQNDKIIIASTDRQGEVTLFRLNNKISTGLLDRKRNSNSDFLANFIAPDLIIVNIKDELKIQPLFITIYDSKGRLLGSMNCNKNLMNNVPATLKLSNPVKNGIYIINIICPNEILSKKIQY